MTPEELLKKLLEHFYVSTYVSNNGGLEWGYKEGNAIRDLVGDEFELALLPYLDDQKAEELKKAHGA